MSNVFYRSRKPYPVAVRAEGVYLWDDAGRRYLDGSSGALVANIGHGRAEVAEAVAAQARMARSVMLRPCATRARGLAWLNSTGRSPL